MSTNKVNINTLIDEAKFTPFHWGVLIWCLLIIIFDGYDLVIYGVALPLLMPRAPALSPLPPAHWVKLRLRLKMPLDRAHIRALIRPKLPPATASR